MKNWDSKKTKRIREFPLVLFYFIGNSEGTSYEIKGTTCRRCALARRRRMSQAVYAPLRSLLNERHWRSATRSARECAEAHSFLLLFFRQWKGEDKFCSNSLGTDHIDIFIVCLNNFFYDRKPKSGSFFVFSAGEIAFVKTFPYFVDT